MYIHWRLLEVFVFVFPICFFATHIEWWGSRVERSTLAMMNDKREIKERWVKNQVEKIRIRQRDCDKFNDAPITQTLEHYLTSLNSFSLSVTTYYTYTYPFWYKHCLSFFFWNISLQLEYSLRFWVSSTCWQGLAIWMTGIRDEPRGLLSNLPSVTIDTVRELKETEAHLDG